MPILFQLNHQEPLDQLLPYDKKPSIKEMQALIPYQPVKVYKISKGLSEAVNRRTNRAMITKQKQQQKHTKKTPIKSTHGNKELPTSYTHRVSLAKGAK